MKGCRIGASGGFHLLPPSAARLDPALFFAWYNNCMADKKPAEPTFKNRNVIDDILDLGLLLIMVIWYFTGIELDEATLAMIGGAGATARVSIRRILLKLWGDELGIEADPAPEPEPAPEEEDDSAGQPEDDGE